MKGKKRFYIDGAYIDNQSLITVKLSGSFWLSVVFKYFHNSQSLKDFFFMMMSVQNISKLKQDFLTNCNTC